MSRIEGSGPIGPNKPAQTEYSMSLHHLQLGTRMGEDVISESADQIALRLTSRQQNRLPEKASSPPEGNARSAMKKPGKAFEAVFKNPKFADQLAVLTGKTSKHPRF